MHISPVNTTNFISNYSFKGNHKNNTDRTSPNPKEFDASSLDILAAYNSPITSEDELPEFDYHLYQDKQMTEEFSPEELNSYKGSINMNPFFYASSDFATMLRKTIENSEIKDNVAEYLKKYIDTISENGEKVPNEKIDETLPENVDRMLKVMALASIQIRKQGPKTQEHTLFRAITPDYHVEDHFEYINRLKALKEGEETVINTAPSYTGFSAKWVMRSYGCGEEAVLLQMKMPKGSYILALNTNDNVQQAFIEPCAKFRVIKNEKFKDGITVVTLEHIQPNE